MAFLLKRLATAMSFRSSKVHPAPEKIRSPLHCHLFWSATRTRHFARILTGDPKRRSTYDKNIRLLTATYNKLTKQNVSPRQFMQSINPLLFGHMIGLSLYDMRRLIGSPWHTLYRMIANSKCEHCRQLLHTIN
uniref:Uncharacterized protein n=1 Tax=viral metagenome TaxID=1070528 RepID=A0A6C0BAX2_9ZZZZ